MPTRVESALMVTDSATSPLERKIITLDEVPLATLPTSTIPAVSSGGICKALAISQAASGMMR
ncbi:hypothetical protein D3C71_1561970 [compost metagenome]